VQRFQDAITAERDPKTLWFGNTRTWKQSNHENHDV
jgi:hypothetical protein